MIISHPNRSYRAWWFVLLVGVILFAGSFFSDHLSGFALWLGRPFWALRNSIVPSSESLKAENAILKQQNLVLNADNNELRAKLGRKAEENNGRQVARVLVGWHEGPFDILAIDLGRNNSISAPSIGDFVLAGSDIWLGEVTAVYGQTSKVKLLSLAGQATPVVLGSDRLPVTLIGRGGGNFLVTLPAGAMVRVGDLALTSGLDHDWVVAIVGAIETLPTTGEQQVFLRQPLKASSLQYVELATH